jgi:putative tricarboxylic transport membrane protein
VRGRGNYEEIGTVRLSIRNQQDFYSGLMFIAFGLLAIIVARDYPMGTAMRMGPGYFPTYLGVLLIVVGIATGMRGIKTEGERVTALAWKPMVLLTLAFCLFGWGIDHLGFVPSLVVLIFVSALAGNRFRLFEVIPLTVVLVIVAVAIFIYGIDLPFQLFWWS